MQKIVPLLLYSRVKANVYILKILKSLLGFQVKIQDFQHFIDLYMLYLGQACCFLFNN